MFGMGMVEQNRMRDEIQEAMQKEAYYGTQARHAEEDVEAYRTRAKDWEAEEKQNRKDVKDWEDVRPTPQPPGAPSRPRPHLHALVVTAQ